MIMDISMCVNIHLYLYIHAKLTNDSHFNLYI